MNNDQRLVKNIIITIVALFFVQCITLLFLVWIYAIAWTPLLWLLPILIVLHVLIVIILCSLRDSFYIIESQRRLDHINLTNWLSVFRISSTPTIVFLLANIQRYDLLTPSLILLFLIFLTDFVDGKLARRLHQNTQIGQYIDSWSDYIILLTVTFMFFYYRFISVWFFALVLLRLFIPIVGIAILFFGTGYTQYHSTRMGKQSIFAIMSLFTLSLGQLLWRNTPYSGLILPLLEIIAALGFVLPAVVERTLLLIKLYRKRSLH